MAKNQTKPPVEFETLGEGEVSVSTKVETPPTPVMDLENLPDEEPKVSPVITPAAAPASEGTVSVPASEWKKVLETLEVLKEASNQNKLLDAEQKRKPKEFPRAFLKVFKGKVVTSWKSGPAELIYSQVNPGQVVGEKLQAEYCFIDGTTSGMVDQVLFTREEDRAWVRIKKKEKDSPKLTVEFESGTSALGQQLDVKVGDQIEIDMSFINP